MKDGEVSVDFELTPDEAKILANTILEMAESASDVRSKTRRVDLLWKLHAALNAASKKTPEPTVYEFYAVRVRGDDPAHFLDKNCDFVTLGSRVDEFDSIDDARAAREESGQTDADIVKVARNGSTYNVLAVE